MFAQIIAAAADYEQSNRTHLPGWERQFGYAVAQNWGICLQVPCRGRPSANREYSAVWSISLDRPRSLELARWWHGVTGTVYGGLPLNCWDRKLAQPSRFQPGREVPR